jgi:hypothetical protein
MLTGRTHTDLELVDTVIQQTHVWLKLRVFSAFKYAPRQVHFECRGIVSVEGMHSAHHGPKYDKIYAANKTLIKILVPGCLRLLS